MILNTLAVHQQVESQAESSGTAIRHRYQKRRFGKLTIAYSRKRFASSFSTGSGTENS